MTEYIPLLEAQRNGKGNVIIKILGLGEIKTGNSKDGSTWSRQDVDVQDASMRMKMTLWNDDIGRLEASKVYGLEQPFWKDYKGEMQLTLGNYCTVHPMTEDDMLPPSEEDIVDPSQTKIDQAPKGVDFKKMMRDNASEHEKIEFARKALTAFIAEVKGNGIEPEGCREQLGAVFNTALMQKK